MSELTKRIITALVLFALAIGWMFYLSDDVFFVCSAMLGLMATVELMGMTRLRPVLLYGLAASFAWAVMALTNMLLLALFVIMFSWMLVAVLTAREGLLEESFRPMVYAQWMLIWLLLFVWTLNTVHAEDGGVWFISGAFLGVFAADIAAYFTGKALGMHKLAAAVSPGKTWEGFAGGLLAGMLVATTFWVSMLSMSIPTAMFLSLILVLAAVLGDLAESLLKRVCQVKDSGRMLPGHGGLLDRVDALIPSLPLVSLCWLLIRGGAS